LGNPDKSIDICERLAAAQEALPHGFPRTKSGVEINIAHTALNPREATRKTITIIREKVGKQVKKSRLLGKS
jgi:hypothetical protein